jgi:hypothetical protein
MEDLNFVLKQALSPSRSPFLRALEQDRIEREAADRKANAEAAARAAQEQELYDWLEEQRRRQFQQEIDAIHARARRRHSAIGLGSALPPFAVPLWAPRAKDQPPHIVQLQPLHQRPDHDPSARAANRSALSAIKKQFRQAAKATMRDDDHPKSRQRRRRGETEGQFRQLVRRIMRRLDLRPQFRYAASKSGRRAKTTTTAPEILAAGSTASPWSNPLNGMDFYAGDLTGFSDSGEGFDSNLEQISLGL